MVKEIYYSSLFRRLCWDEENRLMGVADQQYTSYYQYDAAGERTYKLTGEQHSQRINGRWYTYAVLDNATLYTSPYLVATPKGYTKHYYVESERIASKMGSGELKEICMSLNLEKDFNKKDEPEEPYLLDCDNMQEKLLGKLRKNDELLRRVMKCVASNCETEHRLLKYLYELHDEIEYEKHIFFYHPDHLGSSSWITYTDGSSIQHLHYLPFGESFVDQQISSFGSRYTFSAKEKDTETGYGYFGSRYYSSDLSIWLSVDPMSDKYPSMSAYVYCANNPVKLVDPNGEDVVDAAGNVCYTTKDGWLKNAPEDTKRIGNAMMETKTGKEQFNKMVDSKTKIQMEISNEDRETTMGEMTPGKATMDADGNINLQSAKMTIYEGSISSYLDGKGERNVYIPKNTLDVFSMGTTVDEQIGAVAGHESVHITCPDNLKMNRQSLTSKPNSEIETKPNQIKMQILMELFINKIVK